MQHFLWYILLMIWIMHIILCFISCFILSSIRWSCRWRLAMRPSHCSLILCSLLLLRTSTACSRDLYGILLVSLDPGNLGISWTVSCIRIISWGELTRGPRRMRSPLKGFLLGRFRRLLDTFFWRFLDLEFLSPFLAGASLILL